MNLTASAGVSINKFLAKVASDIHKPDGLTLIRPEEADSFIERLAIEKIPGIGRVTAAKMIALGIKTGGDIKKLKKEFLLKKFGKVGEHFYNIVHCLNDDPVMAERKLKSISNETTFDEDILDDKVFNETLETLSQSVIRRMKRNNISAKTVTLKIKYFDFVTQTRSRTLHEEFDDEATLIQIINELLISPNRIEKPVRLMGVGVSNLNDHQTKEVSAQFTLNF